jgi:hypothetical protein
MPTLVACPSCACAVKFAELTCPHCATTLRNADGAIARTAIAVLLGLSSAALLTACGSANPPPNDGQPVPTATGTEPPVSAPEYGVPATTNEIPESAPKYGVPATTQQPPQPEVVPLYGVAPTPGNSPQ